MAEEHALTPALLADLWRDLKAERVATDEALASFQKFMMLHEDFHAIWDKLLVDPATPLEVEGENLLVHIAMDAAAERSLEKNEPAGIQAVFAALVAGGFEAGQAFHVVQQAMMHEFLTAASQNQEMSLDGFLSRAREYGKQAIEQQPPSAPQA
ncbi:MAG TPA: DUF1841 family protein [Planctomycetota bacterium]|nr:DUF1841 family protein [Planctomycetota bacterium]